MGALFGRVVVQLHRPDPDDKPIDDLSNNFWTTYRSINNILMNTAMYFPESLAASTGRRLGVGDMNVVFLEIAIHACAISLHQAATFTAGRNPHLSEISTDAKSRCMESARAMVSIVQRVPDQMLVRVSFQLHWLVSPTATDSV